MSAPKTVSLRRALDLLRLPGAKMMKMHNHQQGVSYYILDHGRLADEDARTIMRRDDLIAFEDGLIPGNTQCWRLR